MHRFIQSVLRIMWPIASLGLVSPGEATYGVTLIFPEKKLLVIASTKWLPFSTVRPRLSTVLSKFSDKFIFISFGCHRPGGCDPGRSAPSDATVCDMLRGNKHWANLQYVWYFIIIIAKCWLKWHLIKLLQGHFTQSVAETLWEYRADS